MQQQIWVQQRKQSKERPGGERQEMEEAQREKKSDAEHQESKPVPFFFFSLPSKLMEMWEKKSFCPLKTN